MSEIQNTTNVPPVPTQPAANAKPAKNDKGVEIFHQYLKGLTISEQKQILSELISIHKEDHENRLGEAAKALEEAKMKQKELSMKIKEMKSLKGHKTQL